MHGYIDALFKIVTQFENLNYDKTEMVLRKDLVFPEMLKEIQNLQNCGRTKLILAQLLVVVIKMPNPTFGDLLCISEILRTVFFKVRIRLLDPMDHPHDHAEFIKLHEILYHYDIAVNQLIIEACEQNPELKSTSITINPLLFKFNHFLFKIQR